MQIQSQKKILITGGAGFIGSNLCDYFLDKGNKVICLDNFSTGFRKNIDHIQGSIKQIELDIDIWKSDPFYKEKIAREQLGMAREDEIIYVTV